MPFDGKINDLTAMLAEQFSRSRELETYASLLNPGRNANECNAPLHSFPGAAICQLNFYLNVVEDLLRHPDDKPSIGLLLVKDKEQMVVEYSLAGYSKPIGIAQWERQITKSLPDDLKSSLPALEDIEAELEGDLG